MPRVRRVKEMYGDGSRIQRRVRARQQDLTTECDGLLMQDELKLVSKLLDVAGRTGRGIIRMGWLFSPRSRGAFQQLGLLETYVAVVLTVSVCTTTMV